MPITKKNEAHFVVATRIAAVILVVITGQISHAQESSSWLSVGADFEHSDNIDRIESGGRDETTIGVSTEFEIISDGRRYDLTVDGGLNYNTFQNDTFEDEFQGNAFGELVFDLIGERFQWVAQDNFGQIRQDVALPDTPANRENINVFRTGPRVELRLGRRNRLTLQAFYQDSRYENSLEDSDGLSGFLSIERTTGPQSNISLNASARRVEFDTDALFSSYDLQEVYFGWMSNGVRTRLDFEAGYAEIHDNGIVNDGSLVRLTVARDVLPRTTLTFDARSELTSSEDAFRFSQQLLRPGLAIQVQNADAEPFRQNYLGLAWTTRGDRLGVDADIFFESREFTQTSANDRERAGARLAITRRVTANLALGVFAEARQESFDTSGDDFDELVYGLRLDNRPTRRLQLALTLSRNVRTTDVTNLSFDENIILLTISYDLFGDRSNRRFTRAGRRE